MQQQRPEETWANDMDTSTAFSYTQGLDMGFSGAEVRASQEWAVPKLVDYLQVINGTDWYIPPADLGRWEVRSSLKGAEFETRTFNNPSDAHLQLNSQHGSHLYNHTWHSLNDSEHHQVEVDFLDPAYQPSFFNTDASLDKAPDTSFQSKTESGNDGDEQAWKFNPFSDGTHTNTFANGTWPNSDVLNAFQLPGSQFGNDMHGLDFVTNAATASSSTDGFDFSGYGGMNACANMPYLAVTDAASYPFTEDYMSTIL